VPSLDPELASLLAGTHSDPHRLLGAHAQPDGGWVVRVRHPGATKVVLLVDGGQERRTLRKSHPAGLFELTCSEPPPIDARYELLMADGHRQVVGDPYRFLPTLGDLDLHLLGEGSHRRLWEVLGARPMSHEGTGGVAFSVWAPNARAVRVVGDWNGWDGRVHPMRSLGRSGVWELFVPLVEVGMRYKYELVDAAGRLVLRADPLARAAEVPPSTASVVAAVSTTTSAAGGPAFATHPWGDERWMARRARQPFEQRLSIYEVHLGSWRRVPEEGERPLSYREAGVQLAEHCTRLGFTHVELLPVAEHPFGGSWGYQVSGYFAPTARFGEPDDLRAMVDTLHQAGVGVIVDWVPAHFPTDEFALGRFDGTALYEHADPRQGEHPDWGTFVFNYARSEVRNFLVANALYWLEEFHIDGLRVDAVASMLYLDYSRAEGDWIPNVYGGRENIEAISLLREVNVAVHAQFPGVLTIAEESTAWPGVTRPVDVGGLGFTHKWNMGWMHDTLEYFSKDPLYRSYEHHKLTFGLLYAWSENFILPLSHDEVVHGKGSLLGKMPGDRWQKLANLRALYGWMWAHPGKKLLFMGSELGQEREWSHDRSLDWHLLEDDDHRGLFDLVAELNRLAAGLGALWQADFTPGGFRWLETGDRSMSIFAATRSELAPGEETLVCVANLTPVPRPGYRVGLPGPGPWREVLNTDDVRWAGSGVVNDRIVSESTAWQDCKRSAVITLPPLGVIWLSSRAVGCD
jgi:1,4-alpha-glucan branching enzyme